MAKLGCQNSETAEPINTIFGIGDYIGDITHMPKFKAIAQWGHPGTWVKYHSLVVFIFYSGPKFCSIPEAIQ